MSEQERLVRLEEELAFQEQKLEGLHAALLGQQRQLDAMEAALSRQDSLLKNVLSRLDEAERGGAPGDEKPPHYL